MFRSGWVLSYTVDLPVGKGTRDLSNPHGLLQALADGWGLDGQIISRGNRPRPVQVAAKFLW